MAEAYLVEAVRSPVTRRGGSLSTVHPLDLAAHPVRAVIERSGIDPAAVDEVILGCLDQLGPQGMDVARSAWLAAGLPETVPGTTIDRQCGSGQQAVSYAAQAVMSGTADLVVAGGTQSMSAIPIQASLGAAREYGFENPFTGSTGWESRYGDQEISQFRGAELIVERWGFTRDQLEEYAAESHRRALEAIADGRFEREIAPLGDAHADEGPRQPDRAKMASLAPIREDGAHTAATASQISDGSAALLVASERAVRDHGLTPRARIHHISARAGDPVIMLTAPIEATRYALAKAGMTLDDMDVIEINEAFAAVVLAWQRDPSLTTAR